MQEAHRSNARSGGEAVTLTKKEALKDFRQVTTLRGAERVEAWRQYVEALHREGRISSKQRDTWHFPS